MMATITYSNTLTVITCGVCHVPFAIPDNMYRKVHRDGSLFYCPNGHHIYYYEDENTKLKAQLDQAKSEAKWQRHHREVAEQEAKHHEAVARGYKGALVKTKKRIGRGVCPNCNRHFADVERHMACKHPEMVVE
jgi:hypothetical protein